MYLYSYKRKAVTGLLQRVNLAPGYAHVRYVLVYVG